MQYYKLTQNKWIKLTPKDLKNIDLSKYNKIDLYDKIDAKMQFIGKGLY